MKTFGVGMVKYGCGHSGHKTLKLAISQWLMNVIKRFFAFLYKFRKAKSCCNNCWVGMVENGHGLLSHGTLKSAVSQELIIEVSWFFACCYKFGKVKNCFKNDW